MDLNTHNHDTSWIRGAKTWEWSFLSAYPLLMFTGILVSFFTVAYFWRKQRYSWEILQILLIIIVPSSIVGARLWYLISEGGWDQWYKLEGLSIQGGVMLSGTCACIFLWTRRHAVDFRTALGIILPAVMIGQVIGRWGNFNNHEVYGRSVDESQLDWLGSWLKNHMFIDGEYRQPFFLYESTLNGLGYTLIVWFALRKNWFKPGATAAFYLIWYGVVRLTMEPLRAQVDIMKWGEMQVSTFIAALWIVAGIILFTYMELLTMPPKWVQKLIDKKIISKKLIPSKKYDVINPIKERRLFWFGPKSDKKKKYIFFGEELDNKIKIWIPAEQEKWSKKEINAGKKTVKK